MKNVFFILVLSISSIAYALNVEVSIVPVKQTYFDNETPTLNLTVVNNEVSFAAENLFVNYTLQGISNQVIVGTVAAEGRVTKLVPIERLAAGTFPIDYFAGYDFIGTVDTTNTFHSSIQVLPSKEILMKTDQIKINDVVLPSNIEVGQEFSIGIEIAALFSGELVISFQGKTEQVAIEQPGSLNLSRKFTPSTAGSQELEIRAYSLQDQSKVLEDFKSVTVIISNPQEYAPIASVDLTTKQGNVSIQVENNPLQKLITDVSCFITGCKSDLQPPLINDIAKKEDGGKIFYSLLADDSNTGNSKIASCYIRVGADWLNMTPTDGAFDSPAENASIEISASEVIHDAEFMCLDEFSNIAKAQEKSTSCSINSDCPEGLICSDNKKCDLCKEASCCKKGTVFDDATTSCKEITDFVKFPIDTICSGGWPAKQGRVVFINEPVQSCDLFEVEKPELYTLVQEAVKCAETGCLDSSCHSSCSKAMADSNFDKKANSNNLKMFLGLYLIYGLGPASKYMRFYYYPEIACMNGIGNVDCGSSFDHFILDYGNTAKQLSCKPPETTGPRGWASNENLKQNTCYFSDLPASVSIKILGTGTCVDYSVAVTTLLRLAGYSATEVYSVGGPGHEYNLIKFPSNDKWNIIDTVGNYPTPYVPENTPGSWFPYCSITNGNSGGCTNDMGTSNCPSLNDVYGC